MKRIILFFCSYSPLIIIIVINFATFNEISLYGLSIDPTWQMILISFFIITITGILSYSLLIKKTLSLNPSRKRIVTIQLIGDKALTNYLLSTLLPVIGISIESSVDRLTIIIILILLFLIFVQSNNFFFNPFLFFLGYRMYQIDVKESNISKKVIGLFKGELNDLDIDLHYSFYPITNSVYLIKTT